MGRREKEKARNVLDRIDALHYQAKAACSPSCTYDDKSPRWHRDNVLFWQATVGKLEISEDGIWEWLDERGLRSEWIGLYPRNTTCPRNTAYPRNTTYEVSVPRAWWPAPYDQHNSSTTTLGSTSSSLLDPRIHSSLLDPASLILDMADVATAIAEAHHTNSHHVLRSTISVIELSLRQALHTVLDPGHPRFTYLQQESNEFCPTLSDAEVTLGVLRYGDAAVMGVSPFFGNDARPFKSDCGSFPAALSLEEMVDLGGGRGQPVNIGASSYTRLGRD